MLGQSVALVGAIAAGSILLAGFTSQQGAGKPPAAAPTAQPPVVAMAADPLAPVAFLSGRWLQTDRTDSREEHWSSPRGGTMMGMFRWDKADGSPRLLEILAITSEGEDVVLRLHHFSPTLVGKEDNDKPMTLKLTEKGERRVVFTPTANADGLEKIVYHCPDPDRLKISVVLAEGNGALEFDLKREGTGK